MIHGFGKYEWEDGRNYEGEWEKNLMHGEGKYTWPDARTYTGQY